MKRASRATIKLVADKRVAALTKGSIQERLSQLVQEEVRRRMDHLGMDLIARHSTWTAAKIEEEMERTLRNERRARTGRKPHLRADDLRRLEAWVDLQIKDQTERFLKEKRLAAKKNRERVRAGILLCFPAVLPYATHRAGQVTREDK